MREFSTVELTRRVGDVTDAAIKAPVAITQHSKPKFVLMSMEDYKALSAREADPRRAYSIETLPDDWADMFLAGLEELAPDEPK